LAIRERGSAINSAIAGARAASIKAFDCGALFEEFAIGKPKSGLDPSKIFSHAVGFHESYKLLRNSHDRMDPKLSLEQKMGLISQPSMTLSAFASELYLKTLLCVEAGVVPEGHNLERLFLGLEVKTRHDIDDLWDTDTFVAPKNKQR
jgi:hypothetical protein